MQACRHFAGFCMGTPSLCQCLFLQGGDRRRCCYMLMHLLSNMRALSLDHVTFHLPVARRLQRLDILHSRLFGSADGFLSAGWTALTALRLEDSHVVDDFLTARNLPALESLGQCRVLAERQATAAGPAVLPAALLSGIRAGQQPGACQRGQRAVLQPPGPAPAHQPERQTLLQPDGHRALGPACQPHAPDRAGYFS